MSLKYIKYKSGFTLIELLVVISVIAVLTGISLFALENSRESARDARRKADLETIRSGLELYRTDCNEYPPTISATNPLLGCPPGNANTYIEEVPDDPLAAQNYLYRRISANRYELCAALETDTTAAGCVGGCGGTCSYRTVNP